MSAQIDAPKYTYLKRGVYYFVATITLLGITGCKNPFEPEKSAFDQYTACVSNSRDALGDDVEEVCFRKFATEGGRWDITGRHPSDDPKGRWLTIINKGDNLIMVESIYQKINHNDGSLPHRIVKNCDPVVVMPRKTEEAFCKSSRPEPEKTFAEGVKHHDSDEAYWNFEKVLFIALD